MSADNHTPITTGAAANASTFNSPMAELDAAIGDLSTLTTTAKSSAVAAMNELDGAIGDLSTLTTTAKSSAVGAINELDGDIGNLSSLTTTAKGSAVAAINELDGDIGSLSSLTTTAKTSAVAAMNELDGDIGALSSLSTSAKTSLVAAINEALGVIANKTANRTIVLDGQEVTIAVADTYVQINSVTATTDILMPSVSSYGVGREITFVLAVDPGAYSVILTQELGENFVGTNDLNPSTAYTYRAVASYPGKTGACWVLVGVANH